MSVPLRPVFAFATRALYDSKIGYSSSSPRDGILGIETERGV